MQPGPPFPCPPARFRQACCLGGGLVLLGLATSPASVWDGGASGLGTSWNSAANWQGDQLPAQAAATQLLFQSRNGGATLLAQMSLGSHRTAGRITFDGALDGLPALLQVDANGSGGSTARTLTLHEGLTLANTSTEVVFRGANGGLTLALGADNRFETSTGALLHLQVPITGGHGLTVDGAGTVRLDGASTYSGGTTVQTGTLRLGNSSGSATGTGFFHLAAGAGLGGSGRLAPTGSAALTLAGTLAPGLPGENDGLGTLTLAPELGDAVFTADADLSFELGAGGLSDRLVFASAGNGRLDLSALAAGSLRVSWAAGATPALFTAFDLLDWSAVSGNGIAGLDPGLLDLPTAGFGPGWQWDLSAFSASGSLAIVPEPSRPALLLLASLWALRRRRFPTGTGRPAAPLGSGAVGEADLAVVTGTDSEDTLLVRTQQQGREAVAVGRERVGDGTGFQVEATQPAVGRGRHSRTGIEKPERERLGTAGRTQAAVLLCGAAEFPATQFTVAATGDQLAAVRTESDAEHRHAVTGEGAFHAARRRLEHLGRAVAAGGGDVPAIRTDGQGQNPVGMRLDIPERPALGQGKAAHPVVGPAGDQELAIRCRHRAERAVAQAGETAAFARPAEVDQPDLAGSAGRPAGHGQQRPAGDETEPENALGQVADTGTQPAVLGIPGQHLVVAAGDQHLAVAIERQGGDRQRPRVALGRRLAWRPFDQPSQWCKPVRDVENDPLGNPGAQQRDLLRWQRIGLLRHAVVLLVGEEEAHEFPLVRLARDQGRLAAVPRTQQLLDRVQAVRALGLLGAVAFQALFGKDRDDLTGKGHRRGGGRGGEGKQQAGDGFHGQAELRAPRRRFHRAGSKSPGEGVAHRRLEGPRAVAPEPLIERLQALNEVGHLAPRQQAAGRRAEVGATAEGPELIDRAALVGAERRAGAVRVRLELLATGGAHALGGEQGLSPGQYGGPTGQAEVAAAGKRPTIALGRAGGQIPINGAHLGEGVSETGGRLPAGHGKGRLERVVGIEPTWPAWKAGTLPLSYTRRLLRSSRQSKPGRRQAQRRIFARRWAGCRKNPPPPPEKNPGQICKRN